MPLPTTASSSSLRTGSSTPSQMCRGMMGNAPKRSSSSPAVGSAIRIVTVRPSSEAVAPATRSRG